MPLLPPGWRMSNNAGRFEGRAPPPDDDDMENAGSEDGDDKGLDIRPDSPGWEDIEDDSESLSVTCLLCPTTFSSATSTLEHCATTHDLDLLALCRNQNLDFYGAIKLVNYLRSEAARGNGNPKLDDAKVWQDDKYMQPVLEDDALLFSLDDLIDFGKSGDEKPVDYDEMQAAAAARQQHEDLDAVPE